jgi:hypothetical protein
MHVVDIHNGPRLRLPVAHCSLAWSFAWVNVSGDPSTVYSESVATTLECLPSLSHGKVPVGTSSGSSVELPELPTASRCTDAIESTITYKLSIFTTTDWVLHGGSSCCPGWVS